MAIHRLVPAALNRKRPGRYADGGGLLLQVTTAKDGGRSRSWVFRYAVADASKPRGYRAREMGLGSANTVSLVRARELARQCREQRLAGIDPIEQRNAERSARAAAHAKAMTFDQCAHGYIAAHRAEWRSHKHAAQWVSSLTKRASPIIGKLDVATIDTALVMKVIEPIWTKTPETASRLRARIESILSWATTAGYRSGENPARWNDHLSNLLPARHKIAPGRHFAALAYAELPGFMARLRERQGTAELALEWTILTASRTGEVLGAQWSEIDLVNKVWTVPGPRMKSGREHRVPLSDRCIAILDDMQRLRRNGFVFPGSRGDAITHNLMMRLLKRMGHDSTVHGMRSAFRDWAAEQTNFPREIAELALAHTVGNAVERAYARGDGLEKRRALMNTWAAYCSKPTPTGATVVPMRTSHADA